MLPPLNLHVDNVFTTSGSTYEDTVADAFKKTVKGLVCPPQDGFNLLEGIEPFLLDVIYTQIHKNKRNPENITEADLRQKYCDANLANIRVEVSTVQNQGDMQPDLTVKIHIMKTFMSSIIKDYLDAPTMKTQAWISLIGKFFTGDEVTIEIKILSPFNSQKLRATLTPNTTWWANQALNTLKLLFKAKSFLNNKSNKDEIQTNMTSDDLKKGMWDGVVSLNMETVDNQLTLIIKEACYGFNRVPTVSQPSK